MPEFDADLYLRRLGEREVIMADEDHSRRSSRLRDAATALASCGVISAGGAASLVSGYAAAIDLRTTNGWRRNTPVFAAQGPPLTGEGPLGFGMASGPDVVVEECHPDNPAIAWLWQTLADFSDTTGRPTGFPAALSALQAAGLIPAEHPELDALHWVRDRTLPQDERRTRAQDPPAAVPEEWRRFRTGRTGAFTGPTREKHVGAATPIFGGVCVAVESLSSDAFGFSLQAQTSGATLANHAPTVLTRNPLVCWVSDDNGNVYLGHATGWTGNSDGSGRAHGAIEFAALDPAASELTVIAQTARARALIRIPL